MKVQDLSLKYSGLSHIEDNIGMGSSHILLCESMRTLAADVTFYLSYISFLANEIIVLFIF